MPDATPPSPPTDGKVLFVCEHGAVKSLVAKLLFDRYAEEAGLPFRAEARGATPQAALPDWLPERLAALELDADGFVPVRVEAADVAGASCVVTFDLPPGTAAGASAATTVTQWDALPVPSQDFEASHRAIEPRVRALVDELSRAWRARR